MKFYCEDSDGIAPVGAQRVGKIIKCDGKQGCTVMSVVERFSNTMLQTLQVTALPSSALLLSQVGITLADSGAREQTST